MTGRFSRFVAACALAAAASSASAAPERSRLDLSYDVYAGGFHAGKLHTIMKFEGPGYAVEAHGRSIGFFGKVFPWWMTAYARGKMADSLIIPAASGQRNRWRGRKRFIDIVFAGELPTVVRAEPDTRRSNQVGPDLRRGAVDPISGVLRVITGLDTGRGCDLSFPVFDGRRVYDLEVRPAGVETFGAGRYSPFTGSAVKCLVQYRRKAGAVDDGFAPDLRTAAEVWLARVFGGAPPVPVRVRFDLRMGAVVAHLVEARHRSGEGERVLK